MLFLPCFCVSAVKVELFVFFMSLGYYVIFFKIMLFIFGYDFFLYGFEGVWFYPVVVRGSNIG